MSIWDYIRLPKNKDEWRNFGCWITEKIFYKARLGKRLTGVSEEEQIKSLGKTYGDRTRVRGLSKWKF
jgi:hypothetical protein